MQNERVSNERLAEMLAGLEGLPVGPWHAEDNEADLIDGKGRWLDMDHGSSFWHHISRCDPDTIGLILTELQQRRASVVTPGLEKAARRMLGLLVGDSYPGILMIPEDVDANEFANAYADLSAALSVSHEAGDGEAKATHICTCWACAGTPAPTDETQGVKREDEGRLPTRAEAAHAAAVLIRCNGHDLDVWTDGEWPSNTDFLDTLVHNHDQ